MKPRITWANLIAFAVLCVLIFWLYLGVVVMIETLQAAGAKR